MEIPHTYHYQEYHITYISIYYSNIIPYISILHPKKNIPIHSYVDYRGMKHQVMKPWPFSNFAGGSVAGDPLPPGS